MNSFRGAMAMSATSIFSFCVRVFLFFFSDDFPGKVIRKRVHVLKK